LQSRQGWSNKLRQILSSLTAFRRDDGNNRFTIDLRSNTGKKAKCHWYQGLGGDREPLNKMNE
jgi:hypothetical protein